MNRSHRESNALGRGRRNRRGPRAQVRHAAPVPLTEEGVPAATPDAPPPSPVVHVTAESRARFPWIPARVIAGSVWRGSDHIRVRVDEQGDATPWRCPAAHGR